MKDENNNTPTLTPVQQAHYEYLCGILDGLCRNGVITTAYLARRERELREHPELFHTDTLDVRREHTSKSTGARLIAMYPGSEVKVRYELEMENGALHGMAVWYYPNGNRMRCGRHYNGYRIGHWQFFDVYGHLFKSTDYDNLGHAMNTWLRDE